MKNFLLWGSNRLLIQRIRLDSTEVNGKMPRDFDGSCVKFTRVIDMSGESLLLRSLRSGCCSWSPSSKGGKGKKTKKFVNTH